MKIYTNISTFKARNPVVTIGMFDGVHGGHRSILKHLIDEARKFDGESVVLSFWPHPRMLFEGENCSLQFLSSNEEKAALLDEIGIDHFIVFPFTHEFSKLSPRQYVEDILVQHIGTKKVIIGYDHRFGFKGAGGFAEMITFGKEFDFEVEQIPVFEIDNENISSSKIRTALKDGDIQTANSFLTYDYSISGKVVKGNQIGRTIGFPTVNLDPGFKQKLIPGNGIYVVTITIDNEIYNAVANVGNRPTVIENQIVPNIEAYILDFNRDVYEKEITIVFKHKLRNEQKFPSIERLIEQINIDVENATKWFVR